MPYDNHAPVGIGDPPNLLSGMTMVEVDAEGRLFRFIGVPDEIESPAPADARETDWSALFTAAGLDESSFSLVEPARTPRGHSDQRRAWEGPLPGTAHRVRVEASAYRGRVVGFEMVGPWSRATRQVPFTPPPQSQFVRIGGSLIVVLLPLAAAVIARRNVRSGRADRAGASRLTGGVFAISMMAWALQTHIELLDVETGRFWLGIAMGLFNGALLGVVYLALEPFVRRHAPDMLITWSRVISGRVFDPRVGRDLLLGVTFGGFVTVIALGYSVVPVLVGWPEPMPDTTSLDQLLGPRQFLNALLVRVMWALQNGMIGTLIFALLRHVSSRINERLGRRLPPRVLMLASVAVAVLVFVLVSRRGGSAEAGFAIFGLVFQAVIVLGFVLIVYKLGLFASVVAFYVNNITTGLLVTLDGRRLYAAQSWAMLAGLGLAAAIGFWLARQPTRRPS